MLCLIKKSAAKLIWLQFGNACKILQLVSASINFSGIERHGRAFPKFDSSLRWNLCLWAITHAGFPMLVAGRKSKEEKHTHLAIKFRHFHWKVEHLLTFPMRRRENHTISWGEGLMKRDSEWLDWPSHAEQSPFSCPSQQIPVSSEISSATAAVSSHGSCWLGLYSPVHSRESLRMCDLGESPARPLSSRPHFPLPPRTDVVCSERLVDTERLVASRWMWFLLDIGSFIFPLSALLYCCGNACCTYSLSHVCLHIHRGPKLSEENKSKLDFLERKHCFHEARSGSRYLLSGKQLSYSKFFVLKTK